VNYLIDTNVLLRSRDAESPHQDVCTRAVRFLIDTDETAFVCTQVLAEYWVVATRPRDVNGLALSVEATTAEIDKILAAFDSLAEPEDGARRWLDMVLRHGVTGKPAHDARLVAIMLAHGVTQLLTLNPGDFARYPEITTVTPQEIVSQSGT
jgi:predicted nucleic acid-binding protein